MSYRIQPDESVAAEVRRIADEQLSNTLDELADGNLSQAEKVHQLRKRCKKVRGLLRLVRPEMEKTFKRENAALRDAARKVAELRDAKVMQESYDRLMARFEDEVDRSAFGNIRATLTRRRNSLLADEGVVAQHIDDAAAALRAVRNRVDTWSFCTEGFGSVADGLAKTYRRARRMTKKAFDKPTAERIHEFRKRAKYHRLHCDLLHSAWPAELATREREAHKLTDLLGDAHDLAVMQAEIRDDPEAFGDAGLIETTLGLIDQRREELRRKARPLAERLFAESDSQLAKRVKRYWKVRSVDPLPSA